MVGKLMLEILEKLFGMMLRMMTEKIAEEIAG
jgi:hypothetical protein